MTISYGTREGEAGIGGSRVFDGLPAHQTFGNWRLGGHLNFRQDEWGIRGDVSGVIPHYGADVVDLERGAKARISFDFRPTVDLEYDIGGIFDYDYGFLGSQIPFNVHVGVFLTDLTDPGWVGPWEARSSVMGYPSPGILRFESNGNGEGGGPSVGVLTAGHTFRFDMSYGINDSVSGGDVLARLRLNLDPLDNPATAVPLPGVVWGGLALLSGVGITRRLRRKAPVPA